MSLIDLMRLRRSRYQLTAEIPLPQQKVEKLLVECLELSPSAFNSQTARLMLLVGKAHQNLWQLTQETLHPLAPPAGWEKTRNKIASFASAYGTILYFDDQASIQALQAKFPLYKDQFPVWAAQANGMLQFAVWTALAEAGMGASLQHYNPLIDAGISKLFAVPEYWKLTAQMPFGIAVDIPEVKTNIPLDQRFIIRD